MIKAVTVSDWKRVDNSETVPQRDNTGVGFLAGAAVVGLVAVLHNSDKNERHQREFQQVYSQGYSDGYEEMKQALSAKEMEVAYLNALRKLKDAELTKKNAEIDRLNGMVENLSKTVKLQQLQITAPVLSSGNDGNNGDSQLN